MTEEKTTAEVREKEQPKVRKVDELRPDFTDYVALTLAMLQTTLFPFILIFAAVILLYISLEVAVNNGPVWLIAIWLPFSIAVVLFRRFSLWRRLQKIKSELK